MWPSVSSLGGGGALQLCQGAASSVGRAPRWLPVDKLLTQSPCCLNSLPPTRMFRKHGGGRKLGLAGCSPSPCPGGREFLFSRLKKKVVAQKKKSFSQFLLTFFPPFCAAPWQQKQACSRALRVMSCWQRGRWEDGEFAIFRPCALSRPFNTHLPCDLRGNADRK